MVEISSDTVHENRSTDHNTIRSQPQGEESEIPTASARRRAAENPYDSTESTPTHCTADYVQ